MATGATATNSGNITVTNGGIGIDVASGASGLTTTANNTGSITVNGGSTADRTIGVLADGAKAVANMKDGSTLKLNGTGAIGAQALNGATISIAGSALPVFGGTDEIAFHALGAGSTIANTATALDASGVRSTLFRIEDGAGLSSTTALTTSGQGSVAINATGKLANVALTGGSLSVSGANSTGIIVEGGASGSIASNVTATLSGSGGTVGIVDGQKHDLSGANSGSVQATTSLTNAATVNASANEVLGFIARNQGQFTNNGALNFTGTDAIGIAVVTGATATNSGAIAITNGSTGIYVASTGSTLATTANNSAAITVNGGSVANRSIGVIADGAKAVANLNAGATLSLKGSGAIGAEALNGATINLVAGATPIFAAADQIAFHAFGAGSTIASAATALDATTQNSTLFRIEDGASLTTNSAMTASGNLSTGVNATGTGASVMLASGSLSVTGENAVGLRVEGGASGTINAGVTADFSGAGSHIGVVDGEKHLLNGSSGGIAAVTSLTNKAAINADGSDGVAFVAKNRATMVNSGAISLDGSNAIAVHVQSGATLTNSAAITVADGTGVLLEGVGSSIANSQTITASDGIAALALQNGANVLASAGTYVGAGSAHGVLLGNAATAFSAGAATLTSNGSGNALENAAELSGIDLDGTTFNVGGSGNGIRTATSTVTDATATINVTGAGTGYQFQRADGSASANDLNLGTGYVFSLTGEGATGVNANTAGAVEVDAAIDVTGAGATGVTIAAAASANIGGTIDVGAAGSSALKVATGNLVSNTGTLTSASSAAVVDLTPAAEGARFTNAGTINAATAQNVAIQGTEAGNQINLADGAIAGIVRGGAASDMVNWVSGTLNGSIEMGGGNDSLTISNKAAADLATVYHIDGGPLGDGEAGDTLTLSHVQYKGGSFDADDLGKGINLMAGWDTINLTNGTEWELTDKLTLEDPELNIDATSSLLAGNGVNPVISASDGLVTLNNAGLIDLTNGESAATDTLTLEGTYVGKSGSIAFQTVLGDDTSATDRFIVKGDTAGTSSVTVANVGGKGAMTNEGIEIISVSGNSAGTFSLAGDYEVDGKGAVVAGAYAYQLYQGNRTGTESKNWYLRTEYKEPTDSENEGNNGGLPPLKPETGTNTDPVTPTDPVDPADPVTPVKPLYQAGVPSYEAYPQALLGLNGLGTLQQRVGNRFWSGKGNRVIAQGADAVATPYAAAEEAATRTDGNGVWGRIEGAHDHIEPRSSTSSTDFDQNRLKMQAGVDGLLSESENGSLIGGLFVHYTHGKTKTASHHGDGEISTEGYGLGGTLTWYGDNGLYVDAQAQLTWYQSDLTSTLARRGLTDGNDGIGYALSLESGKRFALNEEWSVTPQAQLSWSGVDFDSFTDTFGANVSLDRGNSLQGRLGITLDHETSWQNANGLTDRAHVYGIANLYHEFLDGTRVDVSGVSFASKQDRLWGGLGLGGSYNWNDDKYSIYGEGLINTSLTNFADSYSVKGNIGFRVKW